LPVAIPIPRGPTVLTLCTSLGMCARHMRNDGAAGRALGTLPHGLADDLVRDRYRELGGLCIPTCERPRCGELTGSSPGWRRP
jgi:hypothetical protein